MTHPDFSAKALTPLFSSAGSAFVVVIFFVMFQYVFKLEFDCPCDPTENLWFCLVYIFLPVFIFFQIIILADRVFLELCSSRYFLACTKRVLRALTVGGLWIATALLDGDCVVCFWATSSNTTVRTEQPPCKKEPTSEEFADIRHFQNISRMSGLVVMAGILFVWTLVFWSSKGKTYFSKSLYGEYVVEETDHLLETNIKEMAKEEATPAAKNKLKEIGLPDGPQQHSVPTANP